MDLESQKILEETLELTKENNKLLHKIRGFQKWQTFWSALKIVIVVGVALGVAYYVQPYFDKAMGFFSEVSGIKQDIEGISLQDLLKNINP